MMVQPTVSSPSTTTEATALNTKQQQDEESGLSFSPPLYIQRAQTVQRVLQQYGCRRVVDAGCSHGELLLYLLNGSSLHHSQLTAVTAIDLDPAAVAEVLRVLPYTSFSTVSYTEKCDAQCVHGDLTAPTAVPADVLPYAAPLHHSAPAPCTLSELWASPAAPEKVVRSLLEGASVDAVISIEVIEHIPPHLVAAYTHTIFAELGAARGARLVLLTTPNRDENGRLPPRGVECGDCSRNDGRPLSCISAVQERHVSARGGTTVEASSSTSNGVNSVYRPWELAPRRRHDEHFFELTRQQWRRYVAYVERCYGAYWKAESDVLLGDAFTQGTLFVARGVSPAAELSHGSSAVYRDGLAARARQSPYNSLPFPLRGGEPAASSSSVTVAERNSTAPAFLTREAAIAAFPFAEVFGMSAAEYAACFLAPPPQLSPHVVANGGDATRSPGGDGKVVPGGHGDGASALSAVPKEALRAALASASLGSAHPYSRAGLRTIDGTPLWHRFKDVVRRCYPADESSSAHTPPAALRLTMPAIYATHLAPALHAYLEQCTLPLLLRCLCEQRDAWRQDVRDDAERWRLFLCERRRQHALLRARPLHVQDAHRAAGGAASITRGDDVMRLRPCAAAEAGVVGMGHPSLLLFPYCSVAWAALVDMEREAGSGRWCDDGVRLLEKGATDSTGLLLLEWLCSQVSLVIAAATAQHGCTTPRDGASSSGSAVTMRALPLSVLQLIFFMVAVDVTPSAFRALQVGWGGRARHVTALYHHVSTHSSAFTGATTATAKRRRMEGGARDDEALPCWLRALLSYPMEAR